MGNCPVYRQFRGLKQVLYILNLLKGLYSGPRNIEKSRAKVRAKFRLGVIKTLNMFAGRADYRRGREDRDCNVQRGIPYLPDGFRCNKNLDRRLVSRSYIIQYLPVRNCGAYIFGKVTSSDRGIGLC